MTHSTLTTAFTLATTIGGAAVTGTVNVSGNTATFAPAASLAGITQYTAIITTAAKDAAGNALAANYSWNFTGAPTGAKSYTTSFPLSENPISDGSWTNGLTTGLDWNNVKTVSGHAVGTAFTPSTYADNIACLSGFAADQYIEGVVFRAPGYNPSTVHELELLLRFSISAKVARGYEILMDTAGNAQIVRWEGPVGVFTVLNPTGTGTGTIANGDVIRATIVGSTITVLKNDVQVWTVTDTTWSTGNPGIGMFTRGPDGVLENYGWASITAGDL
jgi:hypothetical protein